MPEDTTFVYAYDRQGRLVVCVSLDSSELLVGTGDHCAISLTGDGSVGRNHIGISKNEDGKIHVRVIEEDLHTRFEQDQFPWPPDADKEWGENQKLLVGNYRLELRHDSPVTMGVTPSQLRLEPGGQPMPMYLTLTNACIQACTLSFSVKCTSELDFEYTFEDENSSVIDPSHGITVTSDTPKRLKMLVKVPRAPTSRADIYPIELAVYAEHDPNIKASTTAKWEVLPFADSRWLIYDGPSNIKCGATEIFNFKIKNSGNAEVEYTYEMIVQERPRFNPEKLRLLAGEEKDIAISVSLGRAYFLPRRYEFKVKADGKSKYHENIPEIHEEIEGRFDNSPNFPAWGMILLLLLLSGFWGVQAVLGVNGSSSPTIVAGQGQSPSNQDNRAIAALETAVQVGIHGEPPTLTHVAHLNETIGALQTAKAVTPTSTTGSTTPTTPSATPPSPTTPSPTPPSATTSITTPITIPSATTPITTSLPPTTTPSTPPTTTPSPTPTSNSSGITVAVEKPVHYSTLEQKITLSAQLNGLSASSKGKITFTINLGLRTLTESGDVVPGGNVTVDVLLPANTPMGNYPISASYSGMNGFTGSSTLRINPTSTTIEFITPFPSGVNYAASNTITLTAQVNPADSTLGSVDEGSISFFVKGPNLNIPAIPIGSSGMVSASITLPRLNVGTYTVQADYKGSTNFVANSTTMTTSASFEVKPITITVTANNQTFPYGHVAPALRDYTVSGLVTGDTEATVFTGTLATNAQATSPVSTTYSITQGTLMANSNYTMKFFPGNLTITAAPLLVTANNQTFPYGHPLVPQDYTYTVSGLVNSDNQTSVLTVVLTSTVPSPIKTGYYDIITNTLVANSNYEIKFVKGTLRITPAPLTITAHDQTRTYGSTSFDSSASAYTVSGIVNDDKDVLTGVLTTTATITSGVGAYPITSTLAVNTSNYNYTISTFNKGTLKITPATVTVTATNQTYVYGSLIPVLDASAYTCVGLILGDTLSGVLVPNADAASPVGVYTITSNLRSDNYTVSFNPGILTITPAPLTVTADPVTRTYGSPNPQFTFTYRGFVNGDSPSVLDTPPTATTTTTMTTSPGDYAFDLKDGSDNNYNIKYEATQGQLKIVRAPLTVSAGNQARMYGEAIDPLFPTYSGFLNGENEGSLSTKPTTKASTATAGSPAGVYELTVSGGSSDNYEFVYHNGTLTINNPRPVVTGNTEVYAHWKDTEITLTGTDFVAGSSVRWNNGSEVLTLTLTFTSGGELRAIIPANKLTTTGSATVTVFNPGPGGGMSTERTVTIHNPVPHIDSLDPPDMQAHQNGNGHTPITINGTEFTLDSVVEWDGPGSLLTLTPTFVSATQIIVDVPNNRLDNPGTTATVRVFNPTPGGGWSNSKQFSIN